MATIMKMIVKTIWIINYIPPYFHTVCIGKVTQPPSLSTSLVITALATGLW